MIGFSGNPHYHLIYKRKREGSNNYERFKRYTENRLKRNSWIGNEIRYRRYMPSIQGRLFPAVYLLPTLGTQTDGP